MLLFTTRCVQTKAAGAPPLPPARSFANCNVLNPREGKTLIALAIYFTVVIIGIVVAAIRLAVSSHGH
ncbi:MAG TPA: hypothetical protein VN613_00650 [Gemmatimonadaceae bacterium]|nr:hypothetical protein [Gemmatimonadaceae bacterium]